MQAYKQPISLWHLVEQHVPPHEHEEIKDMLGVSLVDQSLELHGEIESLLDIWRELRNEKSESSSPPCSLPEPPDQRDRLVQEICFFMDNVKEKAKEKGIDPQFILKRHNSQILDYASEHTRSGSAGNRISLQSSDGRETPMIPITANRLTQEDEITSEVQAVNKKLNFLDFDEVCEDLRSYLENEVKQLMEDTQFLHGCLDTEADVRDCITPHTLAREPTLSELKGERSWLEKELLATNQIQATPHVIKPSFSANKKVILPGSQENSLPPAQSSPLKLGQSVAGTVRGKPEISTDSKVLDVSKSVKAKTVPQNKTSASAVKNSSTVTTSVQHSVSKDRNARLLKSNTVRTTASTAISKPESSVSLVKDNDTLHNHKQPTNNQYSQKAGGLSKVFTFPAASVTKKANSAVKVGVVKRRTASPGRVKVVELAAVVDTLSVSDDTCVPGFSPLSTSSGVHSASSSCSVRPSSSHAERFRKMVQECRDGD